MNGEKVSVIIPTYKGSDNVCRAVESVLNQMYNYIEIIVVDDNGRGTEEQLKTQEVLKNYIEAGNIKYLTHEKNINGSAARNTGVRASHGDYVAFLDDDDEYLPDNIKNHIEKFRTLSADYGITYCAKRLFFEDGRQEVITPHLEGDILFDFMCAKMRMGSSFIMVKREAYDDVNGFDESFIRHQDWEFIARVLAKYKAGAIQEVGLNKYLIFRNSAKSPEQYEKNRLYYLERLKYIIDSFDKKQQRKIYDTHYISIGKEYLKAKKLKESITWAKKTSCPFKSVIKYFKDFVSYIKKQQFV